MRFVCCKCLKLISDAKIIRMPFESNENEYWCVKCHDDWANVNPYRYPIKLTKKSKGGKKK